MASEVTQVEAFANFSDSESDADDIRFAGGSGRGRGEVKNPEDAEVLHDVQAFDVDLEGDDESEDHVFGFKDDHADYGDEDLESADEEGGRRAEDDAAAAAPDPDFRRDRRRRKTEYSPVHALYTVDVADPEEAPRGGGGRRDSGRHHRRAEGKYEEEEEGGEAEEKPASIATAAAPRRGDVLDGEVDDFEDGDQVELGSPPAGRRRGAASASTSVFSSSADADSSRDGRTSGRSRARLPEAVPSAFEPSSDALWRVSPSVLQCVVVRNRRGMNRFYPQYQLYWQDKDSEVLLMCAQKQRSNKTSNYHIFDMTVGMVGSKLSKKHRNYMGKVRTSFRKHDCAVYGPGENPKRLEDSPAPHEQRLAAVRPELAAVFFRKVSVVSHLTEGPVPRKMHVAVPAIDPDTGKPYEHRVLKEEQSLLARADEDTLEPFIQLDTKEPTFQNGTYRLNFHQRVTEASVKNFQLIMSPRVPGETQRAREVFEPEYAHTKASVGRSGKGLQRSEDIVMQFGKVSEDRFHLDLRAPVTPFQAFAVCLCQFNL